MLGLLAGNIGFVLAGDAYRKAPFERANDGRVRGCVPGFAHGGVYLGERVRFSWRLRRIRHCGKGCHSTSADDGQHEAQGCVEICARIEKGLSMEHEAVSVTSERTAAGHIRYVARTAFSPPFLKGAQVFGVAVPPLEHEVMFVVGPYRAGVIA